MPTPATRYLDSGAPRPGATWLPAVDDHIEVLHKGTVTNLVATGGPTAYVATATPTVDAAGITGGAKFSVVFPVDCADDATIAIDAVAALQLARQDGDNVRSGDILKGRPYTLVPSSGKMRLTHDVSLAGKMDFRSEESFGHSTKYRRIDTDADGNIFGGDAQDGEAVDWRAEIRGSVGSREAWIWRAGIPAFRIACDASDVRTLRVENGVAYLSIGVTEPYTLKTIRLDATTTLEQKGSSIVSEDATADTLTAVTVVGAPEQAPPDGVSMPYLVTETSATSNHEAKVLASVALSALGVAETVFVFKLPAASTVAQIAIRLEAVDGSGDGFTVETVAGTVAAIAAFGSNPDATGIYYATSENLGDGWWRVRARGKLSSIAQNVANWTLRTRLTVGGAESHAGDATNGKIWIAQRSVHSAAVDELCQVDSDGQSNGDMGYGDTPVVSGSTRDPGRAMMWRGGIRSLSADQSIPWLRFGIPEENLLGVVSAFERDDGLSGTTGLGFLANRLLPGLAKKPAVLVATHSIGSTSYVTHGFGTRPFANLLRSVEAGYTLARANGLSYRFLFCGFQSGEANVASSQATYEGYLAEMQSELEDAIQAITGDGAAVVPLMLVQPPNGAPGGPSLAMLAKALAAPTLFKLAGPSYPYDYVDAIHMTGVSREHLAAIKARTYLNAELPLYCVSAVRTNADIVMTFAGDVTSPLVRDTAWVSDPGNYGLKYVDTGGNAATILSVAAPSGMTITVTLDMVPTGTDQKVEIGTLGDTADAGRLTGTRCCLRDSSTETVAIDGNGPGAAGVYLLHRYACQQIIAVT